MVILPTNMFNTVTLPATLWFFDKNKPEEKKDEILFIDARNVYTQVDRAHRKFSDEQIKNLTIISRLYEGHVDEFESLLQEYKAASLIVDQKEYYESQIKWLEDRFPNHVYRDVIGLCKVAKLEGEDGIIDQDYSLNPGRYVGVVIEDDGMTQDEFKNHIKSIDKEFRNLSNNAKELEETIAANLKELFGE